MIKRIVWAVLLTLGALALMTTPSYADSIGPNCGTCQGSIYTLQWALESTSGGNSTYDITYTIDTSGYNAGGLYIDSAAIKVSSSVPSATTTLDGAPGGIGNWTVVDGGINAGGCDGQGSGFECASSGGVLGAFNHVGGTLIWVFDVTIPTGNLITSSMGASIKARYVDANDGKVGALVSEDITLQPSGGSPPPPPVPEPASLMLLGSGLLALSSKRIFRKA
jgi:hypothetical protein